MRSGETPRALDKWRYLLFKSRKKNASAKNGKVVFHAKAKTIHPKETLLFYKDVCLSLLEKSRSTVWLAWHLVDQVIISTRQTQTRLQDCRHPRCGDHHRHPHRGYSRRHPRRGDSRRHPLHRGRRDRHARNVWSLLVAQEVSEFRICAPRVQQICSDTYGTVWF